MATKTTAPSLEELRERRDALIAERDALPERRAAAARNGDADEYRAADMRAHALPDELADVERDLAHAEHAAALGAFDDARAADADADRQRRDRLGEIAARRAELHAELKRIAAEEDALAGEGATANRMHTPTAAMLAGVRLEDARAALERLGEPIARPRLALPDGAGTVMVRDPRGTATAGRWEGTAMRAVPLRHAAAVPAWAEPQLRDELLTDPTTHDG